MTLVVALRNEEDFIETCLSSVIAQDYPTKSLEVLVYDGRSTDGSREIVSRLIASRPEFRLLDNPRRIQAAAWNAGIATARGDIIGIVSGHVELDPTYVSRAVEILERSGADMVGGPVRATGQDRMARAIALAMSTPFGVGGARFRYLEHEAEVDTVFMGICWAETYRRFSFDEEMVRNQDDELSYRLLDAGARIVCSPAIRSSYRSRADIPALARQYFAYGFWKVRVVQKHPDQVRPRHLVPPAFVASVLVAGLLGILVRPAWLLLVAIAASYLAAIAAATVRVGRSEPLGVLVRVPAAFVALHIGYGSGALAGVIRFGSGWTRPGIVRMLKAIGRSASS